ncbi:MAG: hypothetical protein L6Q81_07505 [Bacteroidia bacterium]|nr:hypothetical protein [Bacteroidia bacterium]
MTLRNFELRQLYSRNWDAFADAMKTKSLLRYKNHPHLLSIDQEFDNKWNTADLRIMIFGISTNGWGSKEDFDVYYEPANKSVNHLMSLYRSFYFDGGNWRYGQVFWNYIFSIQEILSYRLQKKVQVIWNNVYKTEPSNHELESQLFNVTAEEINILQPDIILLLGLKCNNVLHSRLSSKEIWWESHEVWDDHNGEQTFLYYDIPREYYSHLSDRLKHMIITYHPNARGDSAGIKLKLFLDKLEKLFH